MGEKLSQTKAGGSGFQSKIKNFTTFVTFELIEEQKREIKEKQEEKLQQLNEAEEAEAARIPTTKEVERLDRFIKTTQKNLKEVQNTYDLAKSDRQKNPLKQEIGQLRSELEKQLSKFTEMKRKREDAQKKNNNKEDNIQSNSKKSKL